MRWSVWVLAVGLLAAACSSETGQSTITTEPVSEPSTTIQATTTTTVVETTSTVVEGPVDICQGRPVIWESGQTYTASCFVLPWAVDAPGDGWRAPLIDEGSMVISWAESGDLSTRVNVALVLGGDSPGERLESILSIDGLNEVDSGSSVVAGLNASWVDVEGEPFAANVRSGCARDTGGVILVGVPTNGYRIAPTPGSPSEALGVGACDIARIWVLAVEGRTVTIIGGTADPDRHDQAVAKIEELFGGMSFEVSGS